MIRRFLQNLYALYGVIAPHTILALYAEMGTPARYITRFWTSQDFSRYKTTPVDRTASTMLGLGMFLQLVAGFATIYTGVTTRGAAGLVYLGAAIVISYPLLWAHVVFIIGVISWLFRPKKLGKALLCNVLEWQTKRLRSNHAFQVVAVAGSVGKTSTKLAVAHVLGSVKQVRFQNGNYNDRLTVPLIFFDEAEPGIFNVPAWLKLVLRNERQIRRPYPYEIVVIELGTDGIGQMAAFDYIQPELGIITSIAPEHMEYFKTLDAVAHEELAICDYTQTVLVNTDSTADTYLQGRTVVRFGTAGAYTYKPAKTQSTKGQDLTFMLGTNELKVHVPYLGKQGAQVALAAAAAAHKLGVAPADIAAALETLPANPGRMQLLDGIRSSTLIDDTYNASPLAVTAALDVLYALKTSQRIAILGSMNELGDASKEAHQLIGAYCDPTKLDHVVTIGLEAKKYSAPAAKQAGCKVTSFMDPAHAGNYVKKELQEKAVVLAKGSQNGVFAEEALKPLLANPGDASKLVRQSDYWQRVKRDQFGG